MKGENHNLYRSDSARITRSARWSRKSLSAQINSRFPMDRARTVPKKNTEPRRQTEDIENFWVPLFDAIIERNV
jgi:hypothetical protein